MSGPWRPVPPGTWFPVWSGALGGVLAETTVVMLAVARWALTGGPGGHVAVTLACDDPDAVLHALFDPATRSTVSCRLQFPAHLVSPRASTGRIAVNDQARTWCQRTRWAFPDGWTDGDADIELDLGAHDPADVAGDAARHALTTAHAAFPLTDPAGLWLAAYRWMDDHDDEGEWLDLDDIRTLAGLR